MDMTQYADKKLAPHEIKRLQVQHARLLRQADAIRRHQYSVSHILKAFAEIEGALLDRWLPEESVDALVEGANLAFNELPEDDRIALYTAPSKGGIWTTWQRPVLKDGRIGSAWDAYVRNL